MGSAIVRGLCIGGIYGLLAVGLVVTYRASRVLNFAIGEIGGLGLFVAWAVVDGGRRPWIAGAVAAVAVGAAVAAACDRFVLRPMKSDAQLARTIATVAVLLLVLGVETKVWGPTTKTLAPPVEGLGVQVAGWYVSPTQLIGLALVGVVVVALAVFLRRSDLGAAVTASADDPLGARLLGIPAPRIATAAWAVGGALAGLAAVCVAPTLGAFAPSTLTVLFTRALAAALLGGLVSLPGALAGGMAVGIVEVVAAELTGSTSFPGAHDLAVFALVLGTLLLRPGRLAAEVA